MKQRMYLLILLLLFVAPATFAQSPYYQSHFPPEEFKARWSKIFEQIGERGVVIVQGAPLTRGFGLPRQSNEFYYLSGIAARSKLH
jgi:hypothetical protein